VRFLIDMPLSPEVATWLRKQGHDAVHASELMLHRATDSEIVPRAKEENSDDCDCRVLYFLPSFCQIANCKYTLMPDAEQL